MNRIDFENGLTFYLVTDKYNLMYRYNKEKKTIDVLQKNGISNLDTIYNFYHIVEIGDIWFSVNVVIFGKETTPTTVWFSDCELY